MSFEGSLMLKKPGVEIMETDETGTCKDITEDSEQSEQEKSDPSKERSVTPEVSEQPPETDQSCNTGDNETFGDSSNLPSNLRWKAEAIAKSYLRLNRPIKLTNLQTEAPVNPYKEIQLPKEVLAFKESPQKRRENCDAILAAGTKKVPCHSSILIAYSPYFADSFSLKASKKSEVDQMFRLTVDLPDPAVLPHVIELLYTGCENLSLDYAKQILPASTTMETNYLTRKCLEILQESLGPENCWEMKLDAISSGNRTWMQMVDYEMQMNLEGIFKSKEFLELPIEKVVQLISNSYFPAETIHQIVEIWLSQKQRMYNASLVIQLEAAKLHRNSNFSILNAKPPRATLETSEDYVPGWVFLSSLLTPQNASDAIRTAGLNKRGEEIKVKLLDPRLSPSGGKRKRTKEADGGESGILGKRKASTSPEPRESAPKVPKKETTEKLLVSTETQTDPLPELLPKVEPPPSFHPPHAPQPRECSNAAKMFDRLVRNEPPAPSTNAAPAASGGADEDWDSSGTYTAVVAAPAPPSNSDSDNFNGDRRDFGGGRSGRSFGDRDGGGRGGRSFGDRDVGGGGRSFGDRDGGGRGGRSFGDRDGSSGRSFGDRDGGGGRSFGDRDGGGGRSFGDRDSGGRGGGRSFGDRDGGGGGGGRSFGDRDSGGRGGGRSFGDRDGSGGGGGRYFGDRDGGGGGGGRSFGDRDGGGRGGGRSFGDRDGGGGRSFGDRDGGGRGGGRSFGDRDSGGGGRGGYGGGRFNESRGGGGRFGGGSGYDSNSTNANPVPSAATDENWDDPSGSSTSTPTPNVSIPDNSSSTGSFGNNEKSFGGGRGDFEGSRYGNRDSGNDSASSSYSRQDGGRPGNDRFGGGSGGGRFGGGDRYGRNDNGDDSNSSGGRFGGYRYGGGGGEGNDGGDGFGGSRDRFGGGRGGRGGYGDDRGGGRGFNDRGGRGGGGFRGGRGGHSNFNKPEEPVPAGPSTVVDEDWG